MDPRRAKQIFYGTGFLAVFLLFITGIYYLWFKPAPSCFDNRKNQGEVGVDCGGSCAACELKTLAPLRVNWTRYFPADNQTIIVSEIKNSNENYGASSFSYTIDVYDRGGAPQGSVRGTSHIYPSQIKYLFHFVPLTTSSIGRVDLAFGEPVWASHQEFLEPDLQIRDIKTEPAPATGQGIAVSGIVDNRSAAALKKTIVLAFLFNESNEPISASKTEFDNLSSFSSSPFVVSFSKNISLPAPVAQPAFAHQFTQDLTVGSRGTEVKELQRFLASQGFFKREGTTEIFGPITRQALANFQKKFNITPASGFFGPKTRGYVNNLNEPPTTPTSTPFTADPAKTRVYADGIR